MLQARAAGRRRPSAIRLRPARVNALLGTHLATTEIERPLRVLGAKVSGSARAGFRVVPPSHRFDLQSEIDLVEEVARVTGYGAIPATIPTIPVGGPGIGAEREIEDQMRESLRGAGWSEMVSLAFVATEENRMFPGLGHLTGEAVRLINPLSAEAAEMPRSMLPGLLRALDENLRQGEPVIAGFALGRAYAREGEQYHEPRLLGALLAGEWPPAAIGESPRAASFGDLKGALELTLGRLHLGQTRWERLGPDGAPYLHPGKSARLTIDGVVCGVVGALHPDLIAARGLEVEPFVAELDMVRVVQYCPRRVIFQPLPRFPAVERDIAVVVDAGFQAQQILDAIDAIAEPLVEEVRVFDQYSGAPIPEDKKSLAYTISYRAADRTLTDDEVNALHERIVSSTAAAPTRGGTPVSEDSPAPKGATMTKADIVERIYEKVGFSKKEASEVVESIFEIIKSQARAGRKGEDLGLRKLRRQSEAATQRPEPSDGRGNHHQRPQGADLQGQSGPEEDHQPELAVSACRLWRAPTSGRCAPVAARFARRAGAAGPSAARTSS